MKSYSHIRSKSDTDFNFDKTSLDITLLLQEKLHLTLTLYHEHASSPLFSQGKENSLLINLRTLRLLKIWIFFFNNFLVKIIKFKKKIRSSYY